MCERGESKWEGGRERGREGEREGRAGGMTQAPTGASCTVIPLSSESNERSLVCAHVTHRALRHRLSVRETFLKGCGGVLAWRCGVVQEFVAAYLALFAIIGAVSVYRARRNPPSKAALRSTVIWSIRSIATGLLVWSSNSGTVRMLGPPTPCRPRLPCSHPREQCLPACARDAR